MHIRKYGLILQDLEIHTYASITSMPETGIILWLRKLKNQLMTCLELAVGKWFLNTECFLVYLMVSNKYTTQVSVITNVYCLNMQYHLNSYTDAWRKMECNFEFFKLKSLVLLKSLNI